MKSSAAKLWSFRFQTTLGFISHGLERFTAFLAKWHRETSNTFVEHRCCRWVSVSLVNSDRSQTARLTALIIKFQPLTASTAKALTQNDGGQTTLPSTLEFTIWDKRTQQVSKLFPKCFCMRRGMRLARVTIPISHFWNCATLWLSPRPSLRSASGHRVMTSKAKEELSSVGRIRKKATPAIGITSTIHSTTSLKPTKCQSDRTRNASSCSRESKPSPVTKHFAPEAWTVVRVSRSETQARQWRFASEKVSSCEELSAHLLLTSPAAITLRSLSSPMFEDTNVG